MGSDPYILLYRLAMAIDQDPASALRLEDAAGSPITLRPAVEERFVPFQPSTFPRPASIERSPDGRFRWRIEVPLRPDRPLSPGPYRVKGPGLVGAQLRVE